MPLDAPQSLTPEETYALCAYLLFLNKILPQDAILDAATLAKIQMPNRANFMSAYPPAGAEKK
jgi:cytochrome c